MGVQNKKPGASIADMVGLTMETIVGGVNDEELRFITKCGREFVFWQEQDCCASCSIEDIVGELGDLIGVPMLVAEEVSSADSCDAWDDAAEAKRAGGEYVESYTWTFYRFATIRGYVTVRWFGSSNGYYSESVTFAERA